MSQPVKLSDNLVLDARLTSEIAKRSIAGQIEFWAGLGRAIEVLLRSPELVALQKTGATMPLSAALAKVGTPEGNRRLHDFLSAQSFPHYEPAKNIPGLLVRIAADGTRTTGRFVNRQFKPTKSRPKR